MCEGPTVGEGSSEQSEWDHYIKWAYLERKESELEVSEGAKETKE